ncbi:hypothetical protein J7W19_09165 [Streptomyces mobaraensis NBRC 13819 = DSM 40847]|uniref:Uncharacterized protein n=1 Tax=Streptomyces mobaraensis (strain ATCC 29032 / DSM 40847 / JCM 4168 / NBRC 13819 / NCIMB 11159 / IPCR 16-22) TaxID=1223523 RepID=M3B8J6_STRM1|nr:hypothetical protein [Streptomyces mobaraensis]EMF02323.1 hypothetical protein H340_02444 [Streptomyces mobaraensis NBRC 13819 = DSM 40847]QTT73575.1 hypothetical protein J7W19_09165 [Streptomyces mobaraensis NBRC 13819 = DSM 40847]
MVLPQTGESAFGLCSADVGGSRLCRGRWAKKQGHGISLVITFGSGARARCGTRRSGDLSLTGG